VVFPITGHLHGIPGTDRYPFSLIPETSSLELFLLFRVLLGSTCPLSADSERLPWGFVLLRDICMWSPPIGGFPKPTYVPPSTFLMLSTVYSSTNIVGLFRPTTTSEIFSSGVFPGNQPDYFSEVRPLLSLALPGSASPSGFCSDCRSVARTRSGAFKCSLDPLLRFHFFGSFSEHLENAFARSPLMALPHSTSQSCLRRSPAFRSMFNLSSCPQRVLPVQDS
jgi:hypothetical protein